MLRRLKRELAILTRDPPPGVSAWPAGDDMTRLEAELTGPEDTPYEGGVFKLEVVLPTRYPCEPPSVRFLTPLYHPNIDTGGRICLDTLKMPPKGSWVPSLNVPTVLSMIRLLLAHPNPDDGLMPEITRLYQSSRLEFDLVARQWTSKYAIDADAKIPLPRAAVAAGESSTSSGGVATKRKSKEKSRAAKRSRTESASTAPTEQSESTGTHDATDVGARECCIEITVLHSFSAVVLPG